MIGENNQIEIAKEENYPEYEEEELPEIEASGSASRFAETERRVEPEFLDVWDDTPRKEKPSAERAPKDKPPRYFLEQFMVFFTIVVRSESQDLRGRQNPLVLRSP